MENLLRKGGKQTHQKKVRNTSTETTVLLVFRPSLPPPSYTLFPCHFLEVLARLAHGNILGKKAADHNLTSISPLSAKLAVLLTTLDEHASSPEVKRMQKL